METACKQLSVDAKWARAVPEHFAAGQSQSNGRAEMAVQTAENQLRTLKASLEYRIGASIPSTHPICLWLAEYTGVVLTK